MSSAAAVLPLGDLTRALLASKRSGVAFGATAATVTIQELTISLLVVVAAAPGLGRLPGGYLWMLAVTVGIGAVIAILTVPLLFDAARRRTAATPGSRRFSTDIEPCSARCAGSCVARTCSPALFSTSGT